ncbi:MAG: minor capsid protein [Bacillota bacterium]|nr:minor capsid protein [Bacillota bacterium]
MLEDVGNYLKSQNLIPTGSYLFYGAMADTIVSGGVTINADNCTCLYETGGFEPELTFENDNTEYPGLQIICRGTSYKETRDRINAIYKALHGCSEISGIDLITAIQSPAGIGKDEKLRWEFSVNFKVTKQM